MKILPFLFFFITIPLFAQDKEGDLQLPVSDLPEIQKQEEELPPTIDEVPMYEDKSKKVDRSETETKKEKATKINE